MYTKEPTFVRQLPTLLPKGSFSQLRQGPREKALEKGIQSLSDQELVMMIIGSGSSHGNVQDLAAQVLPVIHKSVPTPLEPTVLQEIKGIGNAKASVLSASLELSRRFFGARGKRIQTPADVFPLIAHYGRSKQEHFLAIPLNGAHEVLGIYVVSIGLVNRTVVHPREVFAPAMEQRAAAIVVAHNHPSGNLVASKEDREVTRRLTSAGEILGIPVLDHLIFCEEGFFSMLEDHQMG